MDRFSCRGDRRRPAVNKRECQWFQVRRQDRPPKKITAMVPRGSPKTACLNHPPGHENDPRTPNGQRHFVETGILLDLPRQLQASEVPWRSGRFQRPAGTEATRDVEPASGKWASGMVQSILRSCRYPVSPTLFLRRCQGADTGRCHVAGWSRCSRLAIEVRGYRYRS